MKKPGTEKVRILKRVTVAFGRHRRRHQGRNYSKQLKTLALSAVESGLTAGAVAQAAGVSPQSLSNWQGASVKPRELKLVEKPSAASEPSMCVDHLPPAWIRLSSGVSIEVPMAAVTLELIAALNGGGVR